MTRRRSQPAGPEKATSQRDLSRRLGVSRSTVDRWRRDGLECDCDGGYDIERAKEFQRVRLLRARDVTAERETRRDNVLILKEDRLRVDLELARHKVLIARGEWVSREDVIRQWRRGVVNVRNRLLGLGRELAPHLSNKGPNEIKALIDARIYEILRLLARDDARANGKEDAEHRRPPTSDTLIHQPIEGGRT